MGILKPSIAASMANHGRSKQGTATKRKSVPPPKPKVGHKTTISNISNNKTCAKCGSAIFGKNMVIGPDGATFHPNCFRCKDCDKELKPNGWKSITVAINGKKKGEQSDSLHKLFQ